MERQSVNRTNSTKSNLFIFHLLSIEGLIQLADNAAALHRVELLQETSHALSRLGADEASLFYHALADGRAQANRTRSEGVLVEIAETGSELFKAKSLLALGTNSFEAGDHQSAKQFYDEAQRLSTNALISLHVQEMKAQIASRDGNHKQALNLLTNTPGLAQAGFVHRLNHLNSLSVELNHAGRHDEARATLAPCLSSPFAVYYPEWTDTAKEIRSRSQIAIESPLPMPDNRADQKHYPRLAWMKKDNVIKFGQKDSKVEITAAKQAFITFLSNCSLNVNQLHSLHRIGLQYEASNPDGRKLAEISAMVERELV
jgi:tetratricopeptide (TPR) repeat protein